MKKELWQLIKLSIPLSIAMLAQMSLNLIDNMMMGYLGPIALAAGVIATEIYMLCCVFSFGTISAVGICISTAVGAKEEKKISHYLIQGSYLSIIMAIFLTILLWCSNKLLPFLNPDPDVVHEAYLYIKGLAFSVLPMIGFNMLRDFTAALHKPKIITYITLGAIPLNIFFDYAIIFGKFGFPKMGMYGIGLTSSIVILCMFTSLLIYCYKDKILRRLLFARLHLPSYRAIKQLWQIGWPVGMISIFEAGLFAVTAFMMGFVTTIALAAHNIVIQCINMAFMMVLGISQAAALRVAHHTGGENRSQIKKTTYAGLLLGCCSALFFSIIFILFPNNLTDLFINIHGNQHPKLLAYAQQFFWIASFFVFFDAIQVVMNAILRGMKDTFIPMLLGMGSYWIIGISSGYLLTFVVHWGGVGLWWGLALGIAASGLILYLRYYFSHQRR